MVLDGSLDKLEAPPAKDESDDTDADGVSNEVPTSLVDFMEFYLLNYFKAGTGEQTEGTAAGCAVFKSIGCATCHVPSLRVDHDRRVADVETAFNPERAVLDRLFAVARGLFTPIDACADLFQLDVPWNPGRMEQRNGRIDRVLQRAPEVRCHYFFFVQRPEDRVLQALVRKTETIESELGSLSPVLERRLQKLLAEGIRAGQVETLAGAISGETADAADRALVEEELEQARARRADLAAQIDRAAHHTAGLA